MQCPHCGQECQEGARYCVKCGRNIDPTADATVCCSSCGKENPQGVFFCAFCGAPLGAVHGGPVHGASHGRRQAEPQKGAFVSNIILDIVLTIITCGIYWFFWQARQMRALNYLLREQRFSFILWFLVSIITCFLFNIYYEYIMAQAVVEIQRREDLPTSNDLPVLSLVLSIIGLHVITDAIQQNEINKLFDQ